MDAITTRKRFSHNDRVFSLPNSHLKLPFEFRYVIGVLELGPPREACLGFQFSKVRGLTLFSILSIECLITKLQDSERPAKINCGIYESFSAYRIDRHD